MERLDLGTLLIDDIVVASLTERLKHCCARHKVNYSLLDFIIASKRNNSSSSTMSSSSFGQWYENQRAGGGSDGGSTGSNLFASIQALGDTENLLPMFNTEAMQNISFSSMKATMEAQMPQQIMGMGYQQRFKVNSDPKNSLRCIV